MSHNKLKNGIDELVSNYLISTTNIHHVLQQFDKTYNILDSKANCERKEQILYYTIHNTSYYYNILTKYS